MLSLTCLKDLIKFGGDSLEEFDVLVVGSGTGKQIASRAVDKGLKVAIVDKDEFGGTCLLRGCIPSKTMIYPADVIRQEETARNLGVNHQETEVDFQRIMERTRESYREEKKRLLRSVEEDKNTTFYNDVGKFVDDYTMEISGETIRADKIALFSGSRPVIPPFEGIGEIDYWTNRNIFDMEQKPERLIIIGGGYIGMEFAHFFDAVGTEVTVIEKMNSLLSGRDPEVTDLLEKELSERMVVLTGHKVTGVGEDNGEKFVKAENTETGEINEIKGDSILLAVGRRSNADLLNVEETGVETDEDGWIEVNQKLETSKENIWAGGDAIGKYMLKHVANYEANVIWHNAFEGRDEIIDYHAVPYAIFTNPQIAGVGLTVEEAKKDHDVLVTKGEYSGTPKGYAMGNPEGFCKIIVDRDNRIILGAQIIGPYAPILIQEIVNLMYAGEGTIDPLFHALHIHPALSEVISFSLDNWEEV